MFRRLPSLSSPSLISFLGVVLESCNCNMYLFLHWEQLRRTDSFFGLRSLLDSHFFILVSRVFSLKCDSNSDSYDLVKIGSDELASTWKSRSCECGF